MRLFTEKPSFKNVNSVSHKVKLALILLMGTGFTACQNGNKKQTEVITKTDSVVVVKTDSVKIIEPKDTGLSLALSANAIQVINRSNGSTREITFNTAFEQTITTVEKVLKLKPSININSECGAGPLKMATWDNGLTLLFKEKNNEWLFAGWAANQPKNPELKLSTMAGVGVGTTREEMESAYVIKVSKTSLGYEFATKSDDLFGVFDGANASAKITNLWSGVSCNFR